MPGLKGIPTLGDLQFEGKKVFLRLDLNVPMKDGKISDETRITASLPTIRYILDQGCRVVMASHLGRPKSAEDLKYSLEPVAQRLSELLGKEVILVDEPRSEALRSLLPNLRKDQVILLENLRFDPGEKDNSPELAQFWASQVDLYVNDAFGASHRAHASIDALPRLMKEKAVGLLIEKEVQMLDRLKEQPARPYIAIMGGAKVSDKIPVIEKLMDIVDSFIIGGAMAYTFLRAQGRPVGRSLVEEDKLNYCRELMKRLEARDKSLLLPVDHVVASAFADTEGEVTSDVVVPEAKMGLDIGPKTLKLYRAAVEEAQTIFWNGPMGVFENPAFSRGSFGLAEAIANSKGLRIVGGGDSAAAAKASGFAEQMSHISTGGGASLEYLQGVKMPGLEALRGRRAPTATL